MKKRTILTVIAVFMIAVSGCRQEAEVPREEGLRLSIENSYVPIEVSAAGCDAFEGATGIVYADDISGGGIVRQESTVWKYADHFSGSYDIRGINARSARYSIRPTDKQDCEITLGINYDTAILQATFLSAERVEVQYKRDFHYADLRDARLL